MATLKKAEGLSKIRKIRDFIDANNENNLHVKLYPKISDDTLISISVRFFAPTGREDISLEKKIYHAITELSHGRFFPEENGLLWHGILEINVSYVHRHFDQEDAIKALTFIADDMINVMLGRENLVI